MILSKKQQQLNTNIDIYWSKTKALLSEKNGN